MLFNTKRNNLESRRLSHARALLLLVVAFLFSQSFAQAHIHDDSELNASCVVCHHADNSPTLLPLLAQVPLVESADKPEHSFTDVALPAQQQLNYLSRAPPAIR